MREFRNADEADRKRLIDLFLSEVEDNRPEAERFASDLLDHLKTILCIIDDKLVGTVSWDIRGGLDDGVIELIGLGVNHRYRRQGVATGLLNKLIETATAYYRQESENLRVIYLFMERSNDGARLFYRKSGFIEVAKIPELYPEDDAAVWTKHL